MSFCLADPVFYDSPRHAAGNAVRGYLDDLTVPDGWEVSGKGPWTFLRPRRAALPAQGWKVHVSATPDNAAGVLGAVWDYCLPREVAFKFLTSRTDVLLRNGKYAERGGSGKFVTIYPADLAQLTSVLHGLDEVLRRSDGPYVLTDVRWRDGPLYVRYGGFAERFCTLPSGERALAIADPHGVLVPDQRQARFAPPSWVDIPDVLRPSVAARAEPDAGTPFPFSGVRPLHFSNGGGVYVATDTRTGREVVLKEARPHAGLDPAGADAVRRLRREHGFLEKLSGTGVVPELYDYLVCWEHHFVVEEYVDATPLGRELVERSPLIHPDVDEAAVREYARWARDVLDRVGRALHVLHDRGIAFGDLHPHNILLRPSGEVVFVDLEMASWLADDERAALGAPGYVAPDGRTGADADLYALACLRLSLFLPLTTLLPLDQDKAAMLADSVVRRFGLPRSYATRTTEVLRDRRAVPRARSRAASLAAGVEEGTPDWPAVRESVRAAVLASATPHRRDRLFPGDIEQFTHTGTGLAHGAAGVLYALARSGCGRFPEHERWLLDAVHDGQCDEHPGFYDGLHGIAYALAELGLVEDALRVLDRALAVAAGPLPATLFSGLAGVGLNLLRFATLTGDESLVARAVETGALAATAMGLTPDPERDGGGPPSAARGRAGLVFGPSGPALLFVRLFEATGDDRFLDLAAAALRRDVARCVVVPDGTMQMDEGWRVVPYLAAGSLGVGLVLREFLRHRPDPGFESALARIRRAAEPEFVICPGLFNGRAGLVAFLTTAGGAAPVIDRHLSRLAWHMLSYRDEVAFPGDQLMRLSMDLATGSAGVLFALSGALDGNGPTLPFLTPAAQTAAADTRK